MATKNGNKAAPAVDPNVPTGEAATFDLGDDHDSFIEQNLGFLPYIQPEEGLKFRARLVNFDDRNPSFVRFTLVNTGKSAYPCYKGSKKRDMQELVMVKPGEEFSMSEYSQIPYDEIFGMDAILEFKEKVPTNHPDGREVWRLGLSVSAEDNKILSERRRLSVGARIAQARQLRDARNAAQLVEGNPSHNVTGSTRLATARA